MRIEPVWALLHMHGLRGSPQRMSAHMEKCWAERKPSGGCSAQGSWPARRQPRPHIASAMLAWLLASAGRPARRRVRARAAEADGCVALEDAYPSALQSDLQQCLDLAPAQGDNPDGAAALWEEALRELSQ